MFQKIILIVALAAIIASCNSQQNGMTDGERDAKVDSLVALRIEEINREAIEDRDRRMAIEVKQKADSMVQEAARADNTIPNHLPMP